MSEPQYHPVEEEEGGGEGLLARMISSEVGGEGSLARMISSEVGGEGSLARMILSEVRSLWTMAAPITLMNCMAYIRAMVSVLFLGRIGHIELAGGALSIGFTNVTGYSVFSGLASGLEPPCSQANGSNNWDLISLTVQRTILLLLLATIPISLLWLNLGPILIFLRQDADISAAAASYCCFSIFDLLANSVLQPLSIFLRSQGVTKLMTACSAAALVLHVLLNLLLVSVFRLGVKGVAIASALTNIIMVLFLLAYIRFSPACELTWRGFSRVSPSQLLPLLRLALPSCLGLCFEWWYGIMTVLAGYLPNPTASVAATAVLIQTTSLMYTVPMALAACVSTRVRFFNPNPQEHCTADERYA